MGAVTSNGTAVVTLPSDTEILITREFNAPKELVYRAYTEPDLVRRWWCGERGEMTVVDIDLRVGGSWRYVAVVCDGDVAFHGTYRELVPNERIVTTEVYEMPGVEPLPAADEPLNVVTFTEADGRTTLTTLVQTTSAELRDAIIGSGMETGMQDSLDHLEQVAVSLS